MPLGKEQKQKIIQDLKEKITKQRAMIFVDVKGLTVNELSVLKKRLNEANATLQVVKKTLLGLACKEADFGLNPKELQGQLALIFAFGDEAAPAGIVYSFGKTNPLLRITGGYFENRIRSAEEMIEIAKLPSRQQLFARVAGILRSPLYGFVNVLEGNIKGLIYCLTQAKK